MTTVSPVSNPSRRVTAELNKILPGRFTYALEYSGDGEIIKVRALTAVPISEEAIYDLVTLAAKWQLKLAITPSGIGQRILFT